MPGLPVENPFIPSTFNPGAVAPTDVIAGSDIQEETAIRQAGSMETEGIPTSAPAPGATARPLPTPPAEPEFGGSMLRLAAVFATGLAEIYTPPEVSSGGSRCVGRAIPSPSRPGEG